MLVEEPLSLFVDDAEDDSLDEDDEPEPDEAEPDEADVELLVEPPLARESVR